MMIFKRRSSKSKGRSSENQIESPTDVLLSYAAKTIQSYFDGEGDLFKVAEAFEASLAIIRHDDETKKTADKSLSINITSDHPKMTYKDNSDEDNVNDVLRQSTFNFPESEIYPRAPNREELSFSNRRNSGIRSMNEHEILHQSTRSLYSDHNPNNPKMTYKDNSDEDNVNDVLRQSNYTLAHNCEELSSSNRRNSGNCKMSNHEILHQSTRSLSTSNQTLQPVTYEQPSCEGCRVSVSSISFSNTNEYVQDYDEFLESQNETSVSRDSFSLSSSFHVQREMKKAFRRDDFRHYRDKRCVRKLATLPDTKRGKLLPFCKKPQEVGEFLANALATIPPFQPYLNHISLFVDSMHRQTYDIGHVVGHASEVSGYFSIIESGSVSFFNEKGFHTYDGERGDFFGANAIIVHAPNKFDVVVKEPLAIYRINLITFRAIMDEVISRNRKKFMVLNQIPLFQNVGAKVISDIVSGMTIGTYKKGDVIIENGDANQNLFVIVKGEVTLNYSGTANVTDHVLSMDASSHLMSSLLSQTLVVGQHFGEQSVLTNEAHTGTAVAKSSDVEVFVIGKKLLPSTFGNSIELTSLNTIRCILPAVQPYINASPMLIGQEVEALCRCANIVSYDKDEKTDCSTCFLTLLQDCNISVVLVDGAKKNCVARKAKESLVDVTSIIFHSRCDCLVINKIDVERTLRGGKGRVTSTGYRYEVFVLNEEDLVLNDILKEGSFGPTYRITSKFHEKRSFALKVFKNNNIDDADDIQNILDEKSIMSTFHHPFVAKLVKTFQDVCNFYMIIDAVGVYTLADLIAYSPENILSQPSVRFTAACVVEALNHLHQYRVSHRDIKPSNIVINEHGYCILTGFDIARIIHNGVCYTFCGTPYYMAPDYLSSKGYDHCVDYWALGVVIYEMLAGYRPFEGEEEVDLLRSIARYNYVYPSKFPECAKQITKSLLTKRRKRLGGGTDGVKDIKENQYFSEIDWSALFQMDIHSPLKFETEANKNEIKGMPYLSFLEESQSNGDATISRDLEVLMGEFMD